MSEQSTPQDLVSRVKQAPESIEFETVIATIEANYRFTPTAFKNGSVQNASGTNEGSCKILGFAKLHSLTEAETLALFGKFYREDVLQNPDGDDHSNIRNFMKTGWGEVSFEQEPLA